MKQVPSRFNFRAWDKETKSMYSCGVSPDQMSPGKPYIVFHDIRDGCRAYQRKNCILMQSTGLCDPDCCEIYEGDVCRAVCDGGSYLSVVIWERNMLRLSHLNAVGGNEVRYVTKVLGNRFEQPELMTILPKPLFRCPKVCSAQLQAERNTGVRGKCRHAVPRKHDEFCFRSICCPPCVPA